jgi:hypothetical protein
MISARVLMAYPRRFIRDAFRIFRIRLVIRTKTTGKSSRCVCRAAERQMTNPNRN